MNDGMWQMNGSNAMATAVARPRFGVHAKGTHPSREAVATLICTCRLTLNLTFNLQMNHMQTSISRQMHWMSLW